MFCRSSHQAQNLAGVVAGLSQLSLLDKYEPNQVRKFFHGTRLAGRLQLVESPLACQLYVDVGHNQDAARVLATNFATMKRPSAKVVVLLGMLADKEARTICRSPEADSRFLVVVDSGCRSRS